jgi:hypothetical protein
MPIENGIPSPTGMGICVIGGIVNHAGMFTAMGMLGALTSVTTSGRSNNSGCVVGEGIAGGMGTTAGCIASQPAGIPTVACKAASNASIKGCRMVGSRTVEGPCMRELIEYLLVYWVEC